MTKLRRRGLQIVQRPRAVEASLWRRYRLEGNMEFREALFECYIEASRKIAIREYMRRPSYGLEKADFEHLAFSGLLEAIDRFDPLNGTPFEAYARLRIRGAIADGLLKSSEDGAHYDYRRRTRRDRAKLIHIERARLDEADAVGQLAELAIGLAMGIIAESAAAAAEPESEAYGSVAWREMQLTLNKEICKLPPQERQVMKLHYQEGIPFSQVSEILQLSRGRISQIHRSALDQLRGRLRKYE